MFSSVSLSLFTLFLLCILNVQSLQIPFHGADSFVPNGSKLFGTNLGGWLVLEPWITPSLFEQFEGLPESQQGVDEWTFCEKLGYDEARRQLVQHWETWVSREELQILKDSSITHVRIPIGYWIIDIQPGEPFVFGGMKYLKRGLEWARDVGLKVILDLHGAPGSQNGFDNSGKRGPILWGYNQTDIDRTVSVLRKLADIFDTPTYRGLIVGIELLNEPKDSIPLSTVQNFYYDGYSAVRSSPQDSVSDTTVVIHDSFRLDQWVNFMQPPKYQNIILDTHIYQAFDVVAQTYDYEGHYEEACSNKPKIIAAAQSLLTIVGEWSLATTDCTEWLNGFGVGSRYDGTMDGFPYIGSCEGRTDITNTTVFTPEYRDFLRQFFEYQHDAYSPSGGWIFWTFKAEKSPQWNYLQGLQEGWIPKDLSTITRSCDDLKKRK